MKKALFFIFLLFLCSCTKDKEEKIDLSNIYMPTPGTTFEWRLTNVPADYLPSAEVIDLDAFNTSAEFITKLHNNGKKVIAYLSVGSVENFRNDADQFPSEVVGNVYEGFEQEKWLDVRNIDAIAPILRARLDMIKAKGFDAVEPDNINGYENNTGFPLTKEDAKTYCKWLIKEAHKRGLSIGQKNAVELIPDLVDEFDWILTESAFAQGWHLQIKAYIAKNKAVFLTEYTDTLSEAEFQSDVCPVAKANNFFAILKNKSLNDSGVLCD
ncbi:MAG: endo alpha-1,4 polygalactosaminidase [Cellulophaga sp.]